jgi:hypothetical protein
MVMIVQGIIIQFQRTLKEEELWKTVDTFPDTVKNANL